MYVKRLITLLLCTGVALSPTTSAWAQEMKTRLAESLAPMSGLVFVAMEKKLFAKQQLDVGVNNFTSGKQALDTVIGGGADIATAAEAPITAAAMSQSPITILAKMETAELKTLATVKSNIRTAADLKGKRIAFTAGTGGEVYVAKLLQSGGLTKNDVTLVNMRPQDMIAAMVSGSVDAYSTWEPNIANGRKILGKTVAQLDAPGLYSETFSIVMLKSYLDANPLVAQRFLAALIEAEAWTLANPEAAIDIVSKAIGMSRDELAVVWPNYKFHIAIDQKLLDILTAHAAWRLESGNHPAGATMPDFKKFISSRTLGKLDAGRVSVSVN